jgi:hypothetical protein
MKTLEIKVHEIAIDGLPDMDKMLCRVAFLWDGNIVNGWPIRRGTGILADDEFMGWPYLWEADSDKTSNGLWTKNKGSLLFAGVTHWLEFPDMLHEIAPPTLYVVAPAELEYEGGYDVGSLGISRAVYAREAQDIRGRRSGDQRIHLYRPVE